MILRQFLRQLPTQSIFTRTIMTSLPRRVEGTIPPVIQRAADAAVHITEQWTGATSDSASTSPPPPPPSPPTTASSSTPGAAQEAPFFRRNKSFIAVKEDPLLAFMARCLMRDGRLQPARQIIAEMLLYIHSQTHAEPLPFVREAIRRAAPSVRMSRHTHGAKIILVPFPLQERQRVRRAMRTIIEATEKRGEKGMHKRLAWELFDVMAGKGATFAAKERLHREAVMNRSHTYGMRLG